MKANLNSFSMVTTWRLQGGVTITFHLQVKAKMLCCDGSNVVSVGSSLSVTWQTPNVGLSRLQGQQNA